MEKTRNKKFNSMQEVYMNSSDSLKKMLETIFSKDKLEYQRGDIIANSEYNFIGIVDRILYSQENINDITISFFAVVFYDDQTKPLYFKNIRRSYQNCVLTKIESTDAINLFDIMLNNGDYWDAETKTICQYIQPGDIVSINGNIGIVDTVEKNKNYTFINYKGFYYTNVDMFKLNTGFNYVDIFPTNATNEDKSKLFKKLDGLGLEYDCIHQNIIAQKYVPHTYNQYYNLKFNYDTGLFFVDDDYHLATNDKLESKSGSYFQTRELCAAACKKLNDILIITKRKNEK